MGKAVIKVRAQEIPISEIKDKVWVMLSLYHFPLGWNVQELHNDIMELFREVLGRE